MNVRKWFLCCVVLVTISQIQKLDAQDQVMLQVDNGYQLNENKSQFLPLTTDPFDIHRLYFRSGSFFKRASPVPLLDHTPGLFCKWEAAVERKSGIAPRFRLGSLQYTEWMEGKKDLRFRYAR